MILVLTISADLHALLVRQQARARGFSAFHIIECDRIAQRNALSYGIGDHIVDRVLTSDDLTVSISNASVIWLRRVGSRQSLVHPVEDGDALAIINNDCRGALTGLLSTHFKGLWISSLEATARASDKIGQLSVARACGFRVPRTLVSQSRQAVSELYQSCNGSIVVKTVVGAQGPFLQTVRLPDPATMDDESFSAAPAIYQECIGGTDHLRLNCFGNESWAAIIRTRDLDWRGNLDVPIDSYPVPDSLHARVRAVLDRLGLEMGVVDIKLTPDGEPVWLEVNPQGQFAFLDAFTDLRLIERFADYLIARSSETSGVRSSTSQDCERADSTVDRAGSSMAVGTPDPARCPPPA